MLLRWIFGILLIVSLALPIPSRGESALSAVFPYNLTKTEEAVAAAGSTQLLYVSVQHFNAPFEEGKISILLPNGLSAQPGEGWNIEENCVQIHWDLPAQYGELFTAIPVLVEEEMPEGQYEISVSLSTKNEVIEKKIPFRVGLLEKTRDETVSAHQSWYVQSVVLPVDADGERDARQEKETLIVPDVTIENIKNRLTGGRSVDWNALLAKPNSYLLLDMRNPKKDVRTIHFRGELSDRGSGETCPGLIAAGEDGTVDLESSATEAVLSLNGSKIQTAVVPLYVNPFALSEGEYTLRMTLSDGSSDRVMEVPLHVVKKRSVGIITFGFAMVSLLLVMFSVGALKRCILDIGAKGDIAVSLFAAMAFGGVVVPVTLLGDFLHVLLGPFSGLVTGLLSGVVQYLLLVSLLILFRRPGVTALFFLMRWVLSAVLFGRVTPAGILICAVSIVIIESMLYLTGFYRKKELTTGYTIGICFLLGIADAVITFINMEQLMLFYRLYYADWFIALYMIINGLLYSSLGSWMGYRMGSRLKQVMGS